MAVAVLVALTGVTVSTVVMAHKAKEGGRLAKVGPAPEFSLTTTDGGRLSLGDLRGQAVAVTFIYATCTRARRSHSRCRIGAGARSPSK